MKLPVKKKGVLKPKAPKKHQLAKEIDKLAETYQQAKELAAAQNARAERANDEIKRLADLEGEEFGKQRVIQGNKFVAGYTICESSPVFDMDLALSRLGVTGMRHVTSRVFDLERAKEAISKGTVDAAVLESCFVKNTRPPTRKIYVEPKSVFMATEARKQKERDDNERHETKET